METDIWKFVEEMCVTNAFILLVSRSSHSLSQLYSLEHHVLWVFLVVQILTARSFPRGIPFFPGDVCSGETSLIKIRSYELRVPLQSDHSHSGRGWLLRCAPPSPCRFDRAPSLPSATENGIIRSRSVVRLSRSIERGTGCCCRSIGDIHRTVVVSCTSRGNNAGWFVPATTLLCVCPLLLACFVYVCMCVRHGIPRTVFSSTTATYVLNAILFLLLTKKFFFYCW